MPTTYPIVPGHEIVGRVTQVGSAVTKYKPDDLAAVGCLVDSDGTCPHCQANLEQFCPNLTFTFNSPDKHLGGVTYGGYSDSIVVDERFVLRVPTNLNLPGVAPLLCAGITTYSPLRHWGVTKGKKVGVVGLGGLGHMGVKFAHAFGFMSLSLRLHPIRKKTRSVLVPTKWLSPATPTRCSSTLAVSILFSIPSPLITILTPISTCFALTVTSPLSAPRRNPWMSRHSA